MADDFLISAKAGVQDAQNAQRYMRIVDTGEVAGDGKTIFSQAVSLVGGAGPSSAVGTFDQPTEWISHEQLAVIGAVASLPSIPSDAIGVVIQNIPVGVSRPARYTLDGTTVPVGGGIAGTGLFIVSGQTITLASTDTELSDFKVIRDSSGGTAYLEIAYYKLAP